MALTEPHGGHNCQECGTPYTSEIAAADCARLDMAEQMQSHRAHAKRKNWDSGIILSNN